MTRWFTSGIVGLHLPDHECSQEGDCTIVRSWETGIKPSCGATICPDGALPTRWEGSLCSRKHTCQSCLDSIVSIGAVPPRFCGLVWACFARVARYDAATKLLNIRTHLSMPRQAAFVPAGSGPDAGSRTCPHPPSVRRWTTACCQHRGGCYHSTPLKKIRTSRAGPVRSWTAAGLRRHSALGIVESDSLRKRIGSDAAPFARF
jgi:hypothetical protein